MMQDNEIAIQPITTWVNGQTKLLKVMRLDNYFQYDFLMSPGRVHYCLCEEGSYTDEQGAEQTIYVSVIDGNIDLTWELVNAWGSDDTPIFDYVLQTLGLQRL